MGSQTEDTGNPAATELRFETGRLALAKIIAADGEPKREIWIRIARIAAQTLRVNRISYWSFMEDGDSIRCEHLYQGDAFGVGEGAIFRKRDFPLYFSALESRRVISIEDTGTDPHAGEFREPYFKPLGIGAMLDSPVYHNGHMVGISCHEHMGPPRQWSQEESEFATLVAETTGRLCAESEWASARASLNQSQLRLQSLEGMAALGRLAAGVAHDFRNVLGAAMGYLDLLELATRGRDDLQPLLRDLGKALEHGRDLTRDLSHFGQEERGQPRVLDLAGFLSGYQSMIVMAAGPTVRVEFSLGKAVSPVFLDQTQLERMVLNLVLNARDAMPQGGKLTITLRSGDAGASGFREDTYAVLEIRDTGLGMTPEIRRRIFEPFFSTKGDKGTGLGLAIIQRCVSLAGGRVEVASEPGQGSTFRLLLPGIALAERQFVGA